MSISSLLELCADTIPEGRRVVAVSAPLRVAKGHERAVAVIRHLRVQHRELLESWEMVTDAPDTYSFDLAPELQAGMASCDAMADLLQACLEGDRIALRTTVERFVNEAVTSGAVAV